MESLTCVSLPLNIQLKFAGGTESAVHCSVTLWPGAAADGPIMDMLYGPTVQRKDIDHIKPVEFRHVMDASSTSATLFTLEKHLYLYALNNCTEAQSLFQQHVQQSVHGVQACSYSQLTVRLWATVMVLTGLLTRHW